jgi:hypothetical protein
MPKSAAERQREHRQRIENESGITITVTLTKQAVDKLRQWQAKGETITAIINKILSRSRP